jgi:tetratricopeptide (TPR) repeat protein
MRPTMAPPEYLSKGSLTLAGIFLRTTDKNYILLMLDGDAPRPFAVVYHEYTHYVMRKAEWLPLWLNEGLAQFYEFTDINDKFVRLGEPDEDEILFLRDNKLIPLQVLFAVDHNSPYYHDEQKGSIFYAQSWALTHMLEIGDFEHKTHRLSDYAKLLAGGEDAVTAAQHAFGDLNVLYKQLDAYVRGGDYKMFVTKTGFTADVSTFQARPLPGADANAYRADVMANDGRQKEAGALLEAVLRDDPKNALAHEAEGDLSHRAGDTQAARKWYGEAIEMGSQSPMTRYFYAVLSMQGGPMHGAEHDAVEKDLEESIKMDPSFAPAYDALAHFYGMNHEKLDLAYVNSIHAIQLDPNDIHYRLNAAQVRMEQENYDAALSVLKAAQKIAREPDNIAMIDRRIRDIEKFQAEVERAKAKVNPDGTPALNVIVDSSMDHVEMRTEPLDPRYPAGPANGPRRSASGVLRNVHCFAPKGLTLAVDDKGKSVPLYTNDMYKIALTTMGWTTKDEINACTSFEGMKARVDYAEVTDDKRVAGQIVAIELSK